MLPLQSNPGGKDPPAFSVSANIFPFENSTVSGYFAGLLLQVLYVDNFTTSTTTANGSIFFVTTTHTCTLTGGIVAYLVHISSSKVMLRSSYQDDQFIMPM